MGFLTTAPQYWITSGLLLLPVGNGTLLEV